MLLIQPLARLGISPNMLTVIGLLLSFITAAVVAQGSLFVGGWLVLFAGVFDMFDGAMARVRNAATTFGAFLDSTLDRYSESIILLGLLYYALSHPGLHDALWPIAHEQLWMIALIYMTVVGSLMVSYTKARAEGLGLECRTGMLARPERVIILALGLLSGTAICMWALVLLAVFSNVTAVERMISVWSMTHQRMDAASVLPQHDASKDNRRLPTTGMNEVRDTPVHPVPTHVPPFNGGVPNE
jgi:CDP-diacylglycerol--glycerol-3-phosphate 3-phosphatidyltransferase